jgi:hypothetical protein
MLSFLLSFEQSVAQVDDAPIIRVELKPQKQATINSPMAEDGGKFLSMRALQKFTSIHGSFLNHFNHQRHLESKQTLRI